MIRIVTKSLLIICLITLDILLILDILQTYQINKLQSEVVILNNNIHPRKEVAGVTIHRRVIFVKKITPKSKPTIKVAAKITVVSTSKTTPTSIPTLTPTPKPTPTPSAVPVVYPGTGDLLQQVNSFRAGKGLSPFTSSSEACFFANIRAQEISTSFNHDGFNNRVSAKSLPYPSYTSVAENIAENSSASNVVQAWIDSPGHNVNLSKDVPYACVVGNGNFYVFEAWRP